MIDDVETVRNIFDRRSPALAAFDYLLAHAMAAAFVLVPRLTGTVRSVELQRQDRRLNPFSAQAHPGHINFYLRRPILAEHPSLFEEAAKQFGEVRPNRLGEYRRHIRSVEEAELLLRFLRERKAWPSRRHDQRFVAATFAPVSGEHFIRAAERLSAGQTSHRFAESTTYDLLFNGHRLPPKAVFGLAATEALGFPIGPENFSAGEGTLSFRMLRQHGYPIVNKDDPGEQADIAGSDEDRSWTEGRKQLVQHLRRERATGLAAAKRARFRADHGRLFCERCRIDPVEAFGSAVGEACIEVHHHATHVARMHDDHQTQLEDLICLCANCHRVTHRELKEMLVTGRT